MIITGTTKQLHVVIFPEWLGSLKPTIQLSTTRKTEQNVKIYMFGDTGKISRQWELRGGGTSSGKRKKSGKVGWKFGTASFLNTATDSDRENRSWRIEAKKKNRVQHLSRRRGLGKQPGFYLDPQRLQSRNKEGAEIRPTFTRTEAQVGIILTTDWLGWSTPSLTAKIKFPG